MEEKTDKNETARQEENRTFSLNTDTKGLCIFWTAAVLGIVADLTSKFYIFEWLRQQAHPSFPVIEGFFNLVMVENTGAAFGIAQGQRWVLTVISIIGLVIVLGVVFLAGRSSKLMYVALGLLCAGIAGNLYDRIFNEGSVRDFIDIIYREGKHWPAFNLADAMLCTAVGLIFIATLFTETPYQKRSPRHKEEPSKPHREQ